MLETLIVILLIGVLVLLALAIIFLAGMLISDMKRWAEERRIYKATRDIMREKNDA